MAIKYTVKADMGGVGKKLAAICKDKGLGKVLAETALAGMDKYVPYREGALASSAQAEPFAVTYSTPYARRVYYGNEMKFTRDHHPNATAEWDRAYVIAGGAKQLGEAGTNYLKGRA